MSCLLRAMGTHLDVDAFLSASSLQAIAVFRVGEPFTHGGRLAGASRFHASVSEAELS